MHIFHSEFAHDYGTYAFGFEVHGELERNEDAAHAYTQGFLPRSNDPSITNRFYMARSVRVPAARHVFTSENRRVLKKYDGILRSTILTREMLIADQDFHTLFLSYFETRHGVGVMSAKRLDGILATPLPLRGVRYDDHGTTVGYALEIAGADYLHYWYAVFLPERSHTSLGMWMMLDAVRRAKEEERAYAYLGTAYGDKGKYKLNLTPIEFWNGEEWSTNANALRSLIETEATRVFER